MFPSLLTGHSTLRKHLHLPWMVDSSVCRRCGLEEETSAHVQSESEVLTSLRHAHLGSFLLEQQDIQSTSLGAMWDFSKAADVP
jgi:hypothetical protein